MDMNKSCFKAVTAMVNARKELAAAVMEAVKKYNHVVSDVKLTTDITFDSITKSDISELNTVSLMFNGNGSDLACSVDTEVEELGGRYEGFVFNDIKFRWWK